jgi:hypothetical protein
MELLVDLVLPDAVRLMTDFAHDSFLSDRDPDRARAIHRVSGRLALTAFEMERTIPAESHCPSKRHHRPKDTSLKPVIGRISTLFLRALVSDE